MIEETLTKNQSEIINLDEQLPKETMIESAVEAQPTKKIDVAQMANYSAGLGNEADELKRRI